MPLVTVPEEVGSMTFASGSHLCERQSDLAISDESEEYFERWVKEQGFPLHAYGAMDAGDATFHAGWTAHRAQGNPTDTMREVMTIIYFADGAHINHPDNPNQQADMEAWFPGKQPGDLATGPLSPLLYSRERDDIGR
jgi:ectoine hydroxylase-related dioxygenase (phytanoyl-CoA dioxygenase family)